MPVKIFCCYAHEDEALLNKLKAHLKPLQRQSLIDIWYDRDISAGADWEQEIKDQLNTAQIILLLISPDFMDSEYCYGIEMQRAIERHQHGEARVIPVILRPVYWQGQPLGALQALPTDAKPVTDPDWYNLDRAFYDVAKGILKAAQELHREQWLKIYNKNDDETILAAYQQIQASSYSDLLTFSETEQQRILLAQTRKIALDKFKASVKTAKVVLQEISFDLVVNRHRNLTQAEYDILELAEQIFGAFHANDNSMIFSAYERIINSPFSGVFNFTEEENKQIANAKIAHTKEEEEEPVLILTPEKMIAYQSRRWQQALERKRTAEAPATEMNTSSVNDIPKRQGENILENNGG